MALGADPARASTPSRFPAGIEVGLTNFKNWCGAIDVPKLWTCKPESAHDVVRVVNWARRHGWKVRAKGSMHGWSPLTVTADTVSRSKIMLVDTAHLRHLSLDHHDGPRLHAGAGATMLEILTHLQRHGLGWTSVPATGDPTIAGALTIGAHGAALPAAGEQRAFGHTYGSLSNLVMSMTAVVWDERHHEYRLRTFHRHEADVGALMVHLGRAFITDVTMRTGVEQPLRCVSYLDIPLNELMAAPGSRGRTFESFIEQSGRVESIWFPFTESPWLKVWSVAEKKPKSSRHTLGPYNYVFSDAVAEPISAPVDELVKGSSSGTIAFSQAEYDAAVVGLTALDAYDLWGPSKDTMLYIASSTLRFDENGWGIACRREDIQRILHMFSGFYQSLLADYQAAGRYPMNGPVEVRACGIDDPNDVAMPGAQSSALGSTAPRVDHPEWDAVLYVNPLTLPGTAGEYRFYRAIEQWLVNTFDGTWAAARPEWSKGWAFSDSAAWADQAMLRHRIPKIVNAGRHRDRGFTWAQARLDALDPHRVFGNGFLDRFAR